SYAVYFRADVVTTTKHLSVTAKDTGVNLTVGGDGGRLENNFAACNKGFKFVAVGKQEEKISFTAMLKKNSEDGGKDVGSNA
ncbi:hypothetical protein, partial [Paenibacillus sp. GbtcB18]|uniref:hypothetical protein n=1 Tax=Paenibacillus sp. GbtcB18 TaxID=2824763 RepID=UPI001C2F6D75